MILMQQIHNIVIITTTIAATGQDDNHWALHT